MKNVWLKRRAEGTRWIWRINEISGQALDDLGYEKLAAKGVVSVHEINRTFDLLYVIAIAAAKEIDRLRALRLRDRDLTIEISGLIKAAMDARHWGEAMADEYGDDKTAAQPERTRTTKLIGKVGAGIIRLIKEAA